MTSENPIIHECPNLEQLAAFIDGYLDGDERHEVIEHLDICRDCWEIYTETLRCAEALEADAGEVGSPPDAEKKPANGDPETEESTEPSPKTPRDHPSIWRSWRPVLAIAALLLITLSLWRHFAPLDFNSVRLVEAVDVKKSSALSVASLTDFGWRTLRSEGQRKIYLPENALFFRLGVHQVSLIASLKAGNTDAARSTTGDIRKLLVASNQLVFEKMYQGLEEQLEKSKTEPLLQNAGAWGNELDQWARQVESSNQPYRLGKWAMAGFLAAELERVDFFDRAFRQSLRKLLNESPPHVSKEVVRIGEQLEEQLKAKNIEGASLTSSFEELIRVGGGG